MAQDTKSEPTQATQDAAAFNATIHLLATSVADRDTIIAKLEQKVDELQRTVKTANEAPCLICDDWMGIYPLTRLRRWWYRSRTQCLLIVIIMAILAVIIFPIVFLASAKPRGY